MKTKVTFSLEDELIGMTSEYAKKHHTSVRSIIRKFLTDLTRESRIENNILTADQRKLPALPTGDTL